MELIFELGGYVRAHRLGELLTSPADLALRDTNGRRPPAIVQPDLFVVPASLSGPRTEWIDITTLLLAIEILSPSTARYDRGNKRAYCERSGVPEYWIVDHEERLVERWRPDAAAADIVRDVLRWQPDAAHPPLDVDLPALLTRALDE